MILKIEKEGDVLDKNKKIRILQSIFMILIMMAAVGFTILARTKSWNYPDYNIVETDAYVMEIHLLRIGMVTVLGTGFAFAYLTGKKGYQVFRYVIGGICSAIYLIYLLLHKEWIGSELQQLFIGSYVLFSYGAAWFSKKRFGNLTGSKMYVIFGIVSMMVSKYSFLYDEFIQGRPLTLMYMAIVFMIVYAAVFRQDQERDCISKKWYISILVVPAFVVLFSGGRIRDIICSISVSSPENWFIYRWNALKAVITGNYPGSVLDIPCIVHVRDFYLLWLRQAFSPLLCVSYLLLFLLFVGLLLWMFRNRKTQSVLNQTLILSILTTNVIGIIAETNLIWGADIGILISQNIYQMIPVIWLIITHANFDKTTFYQESEKGESDNSKLQELSCRKYRKISFKKLS